MPLPRQAPSERTKTIVLIAICLLMFFVGEWQRPIFDTDEGMHASTSKATPVCTLSSWTSNRRSSTRRMTDSGIVTVLATAPGSPSVQTTVGQASTSASPCSARSRSTYSNAPSRSTSSPTLPKRNVDPGPGPSDSTQILPPWLLTMP